MHVDDPHHPRLGSRSEGAPAGACGSSGTLDGGRGEDHSATCGRDGEQPAVTPGRQDPRAIRAARRARARATAARTDARASQVQVIILDTNVLSELMREKPASAVLRWARARPESSLYATSISEAEILRGIEVLPKGKRRDALAAAARTTFGNE